MVKLDKGRVVKAPDSFFIDGAWATPQSDRRLDVISPVTEEKLFSYPEATAADMDRAVAAARRAFDDGPWPRMPAQERAAYLRRVGSLITARLDEIAWAWTTQVGAPISLTRKLVPQNATLFNHYADLIETYPFIDHRRRDDGGEVRVLREPVGVCAAISPWNAPMVLLSYKIAAGLAAGCTMVAKPSPETPLEAYILAECIEQAGLPRGVFNLVPAGREAGDHLIRQPDGLFHAHNRAGVLFVDAPSGARRAQARISGHVPARRSGAETGRPCRPSHPDGAAGHGPAARTG